jgi:hypothetical protein
VTGGVDSDYVGQRSTTKALAGDASGNMKTPATTPAVDDYVSMFRHVGLPAEADVLSLELFVTSREDLTTLQFLTGVTVYKQRDGANQGAIFMLRWNEAEYWQYRDETNTWQSFGANLPTWNNHASRDYWTRIQLVCRPFANKWVSVSINDTTYSFTENAYNVSASGINNIQILNTLTAKAAVQKEMWIDNLTCAVE